MSISARRLLPACAALALLFSASTVTTWAAERVAAPHKSRTAAKTRGAKVVRREHARVEREVPDSPQEAQAFFLKKRLAPGMTGYPAQLVVDAYRQSLDMPLYSSVAQRGLTGAESPDSLTALTWTALGPGNVGGRTRAFKFVPGSATTIYAGGVAGGVWKTTNTGTTWTAMGDLMANLAVTAIAIDPTNTQIIYAGTGEGYFNGDAVRGAGIFKSTDGGANWSQLGATNGSNYNFINDLAMSPSNSAVLYAATGAGLFRSTDSGVSWSASTLIPGAASALGCMKIVFRTDVPDTAVATCGTFAPTASATGIWRSTNATTGAPPTWAHVVGPSGATLTLANMGRASIAIAPSLQTTMYALVACSPSAANQCGSGNIFSDGLLAVLKSTDGGANWSPAYSSTFTGTTLADSLLTNPREEFCFANDGFNQGWYDNVIAVDPTNASRVFVSGIDDFRSDDSGATWGVISYWWIGGSHNSHADHHALVFHPNYNGTTETRLYDTNDGGIYVSSDAATATRGITSTNVCPGGTAVGATWSKLNNSYGVTQYYHGSVYPSGTQYIGGAQDNGTSRGTDGSPNAWTTVSGGDGGWTAIDRTTSGSSTVLYVEFTGISMIKSSNNGGSFVCATQGIVDCTTGAASDSGQFINPFAIDPNNFQNLWTSGKFMWRTTNAAAGWTRASTTLLDNGSGACGFSETFSEEAVANSNSNLVVAGTDCGNIFRNTAALSATSTTTWSVTKPRSGYVADIAFDPNDANKVYATYSTFGGTHVWKSTNGGQTFVGIDGTGTVLPNIPAHTVAVSPADATGNTIYVGTEIGVYVTTDGGANWARENTGFANVITDHLVFNASGPTGLELYAFTHGRGLFRAQIANGPVASTTLLASAPDPSVFGQSVTLTATVSGGAGVPTGTVNFLDGATTIASNVALNGAGVATFSTSAFTVGTHNLTANYSGSGAYNASSGVDTQTVAKASTTLSIADAPDPSIQGQTVTVTKTLSVTAPGAGTPGGTISVSGPSFSGCTITLPAVSCGGTFSAGGVQTLNATYNGDASFNGSSAAPITNTGTLSADLSITNSDGLVLAPQGGTVRYTIVVSNAGPSNVAAAPVTDNPPASLGSVTWTCTPIAPATCPNPSGSGAIAQNVTLAAGQSLTYVLTGTVTGGAGTTLANTATVAAPAGATDPTPGNNTATDTESIVADAIFKNDFE